MEYQQFLTEINYKRRQNVTLTEVILLREKMFSCSKQSRYFWNMYNVADGSDVSQAVAGPFRLQLCAVLGRSGIKLSEYVYSWRCLPNKLTV